MKVERVDDEHVRLEFDIKEAQKLAEAINGRHEDVTNGCRELSSLLQEAYYNSRNEFRQPPHAFDEKAPKAPSTEM